MVWECGGPWKAIVGDLIFKRADIVTATHSMFLHPVNGKTRRHTPCQVTYVFCGTVCCIGSCSWNYCKTCFNTRAHENYLSVVQALIWHATGTDARSGKQMRTHLAAMCSNHRFITSGTVAYTAFTNLSVLDSKRTKHERSSHFTRVLCKRTVHWADKFELHLFW